MIQLNESNLQRSDIIEMICNHCDNADILVGEVAGINELCELFNLDINNFSTSSEQSGGVTTYHDEYKLDMLSIVSKLASAPVLRHPTPSVKVVKYVARGSLVIILEDVQDNDEPSRLKVMKFKYNESRLDTSNEHDLELLRLYDATLLHPVTGIHPETDGSITVDNTEYAIDDVARDIVDGEYSIQLICHSVIGRDDEVITLTDKFLVNHPDVFTTSALDYAHNHKGGN